MKMIEACLKKRWDALIETVKDSFNEIDAQIDNGICRDTWETFAWLLWSDDPQAETYKVTVNAHCCFACEALSEFEVAILLAWRWYDYENQGEPDVDYPWEWPISLQRDVLARILQTAVQEVASDDGQRVHDRICSDEEPEAAEEKEEE